MIFLKRNRSFTLPPIKLSFLGRGWRVVSDYFSPKPVALARGAGFTLVEVMIVASLFIVIMGGILAILSVGKYSWYQTDVEIELQQDLRKAMTRVIMELRESGFDSVGSAMITIQDNTGQNNSDILTFSVPVDYDNDGDIVNGSSNIEWGGATLWANKDPNCEAAGDNCQYLDYKTQYFINSNNQFIRRALDDSNAAVREDNYANNIIDFQVTRNNSFVTLELTARKDTSFGRTITRSISSEIYLRNSG